MAVAEMMSCEFCWPLISVICLMLVVPAVETMVLPFRSASERMFADFFATQRLAVTKCCDVNPDLFLAREVVGGGAALQIDRACAYERDAIRRSHELELDVELGQLELGLTASAIRRQSSMAYPTGCCLSS